MESTQRSLLYVYCVVEGSNELDFGEVGIGKRPSTVYAIPYRDISAVVSKCDSPSYERTDENIISHQRVVQKVFDRSQGIPLPFSTVLTGEDQVKELLQSRYAEFRDKLERMSEILSSGDDVAGSLPERELVEEALAQSFASALRIRQLSDELAKLKASPRSKTDVSPPPDQDGIIDEIRSIKEVLARLSLPSQGEVENGKLIDQNAKAFEEIRAELVELKAIINNHGNGNHGTLREDSDSEDVDSIAGFREELNRIKARYVQLESLQGEITQILGNMVQPEFLTDMNAGTSVPVINSSAPPISKHGFVSNLRRKIGRMGPWKMS